MLRSGNPLISGACCALLAALIMADATHAAPVLWTIDSGQSSVRLNLFHALDQYHVRNQNNGVWTDSGGRLATVEGSITTNVVAGPGASLTSIEFLGSAGSAVDDKSLRPNPAAFDSLATNGSNPDGSYTSTATALAAYGGAVRTISLPSLFGYFAFSNVTYAMNSGVIPLGAPNSALPAGSTSFGFGSATFGFDGVTLLGQQFAPDSLTSVSLDGLNSPAGSIEWLGGNDYRMTYNVHTEWGTFDGIEGFPLSAIVSGVIVAHATIVPEPSSLILGAVALLSFCLAVHRWSTGERLRT